jgi:tetratricopeptide (TPR) repeat protein
VFFDEGDWTQAERHLRRAVELVERHQPQVSYRTLPYRCTLAWMLAYRGAAGEACRIAEAVVEEAQEAGRVAQEGVGRSVLGFAMCQAGRAADSVSVLREARVILERELGPQHRESIHCRHHLAYSLAMTGALEEAGALYRQVSDEYRRLPPPVSEKAATALNGYGQALFVAGKVEEARRTFQEALRTFREVGGRSTTLLVQLLNNLGATHLALHQELEAEGPLREAVVTARAGLPPLDQARLHSLMNLSQVLEALGRPAEAAELWTEIQEQAQSAADPPEDLRAQAAAEIRRLQDLGT